MEKKGGGKEEEERGGERKRKKKSKRRTISTLFEHSEFPFSQLEPEQRTPPAALLPAPWCPFLVG